MAQKRAGLVAAGAAESLPVHPLQVYFAIMSLTLGCFCLWLQRHKAFDGQVFLVYVASYGLGQFLLEFVRAGPLPHIQCAALLAALIGGAILLLKSRELAGPIVT
jgi:phosphatidylglycerol:prolipoprotein diacylglycerol transferase